MDSMIKEINDNLNAILENIKENKDNSINTLDNIQSQMDKKIDEAKKYKVQVDGAKDKISVLEEENKSLELSLKELTDKYSKMNLVNLIEAGNKEIKSKINNNIIEINKEKERIQELTNRARTIKDLLINLKKDKTIKEEKLENIKVVYEYYNERINDIVDYAFNHANNLSDYKKTFEKEIEEHNVDVVPEVELDNSELENTMVFDEIANIDDNDSFKEEMSFIDDKQNSDDKNINDINEESNIVDSINEKSDIDEEILNHDNFKDGINKTEENKNIEEDIYNETVEEKEKINQDIINNINLDDNEEIKLEPEVKEENGLVSDEDLINIKNNDENNKPMKNIFELDNNNDNIEEDVDKTNIFEVDKNIDKENSDRLNKINDLFSSVNNVPNVPVEPQVITGVEEKIDNAYKDIFGKELNEKDLNKKDPTLTDIFGNPIKNEDLSAEVKNGKKIEELFNMNGLDFNKFREDEQTYLKQIYDSNKFNEIIEVLKKHKINLDNLYYAFNLFGEISALDLDNIINKLINVGQSIEAIGIILEKLPKVKKYNLEDAINSYGNYVKDIDITELIIKAKELYQNGGNV